MKFSSKPITSPSRTEKLPSSLARFLRSNGRNSGRGRSRSTPLFFRKKNTTVETQEPTSPKVTCIGQVRVGRSKQGEPKSSCTATKRRCRWIPKALFCNHFSGKSKSSTAQPIRQSWFVFFLVGYRRMVEINKGSARRELKSQEKDEQEENDDGVFVSSSPPKNALVLMRCRSEPASSLANRFWDSPSTVQDTVEVKTEPENRAHIESEEEETDTLEKETICRDSDRESMMGPEIDDALEFCEGLDESLSSERSIKPAKTEDELSERGGFPRFPILRKCKSVPARRSGNPDSETCFRTDRRLGFSESCTPRDRIKFLAW